MDRNILEGFVLPPDKSILHRLLIIGSLSNAAIDVPLRSSELPEDIEATIDCLLAFGVPINRTSDRLHIQGVGLHGWKTPDRPLDCRNSGTTARLLMGALSGMQIEATLTGDDSLSKRPMKRLANLLAQFGADMSIADSDGLPVTVRGKSLHAADVATPVASAQLKSALLLAALQASGTSTIREPLPSRNHTELMLQAFGAAVQCRGTETTVNPIESLSHGGTPSYDVPCDISAAYYLIGASILAHTPIRLQNVLLNPTRTALLSLLNSSFHNITVTDQLEQCNELRGGVGVATVQVPSISIRISSVEVPSLIDELPLLAVLAAFFDGETVVEGAGELRYKESDRLRLIIKNLQKFGAEVEENMDGFSIYGKTIFTPKPAAIEHDGDHRIAMAFSLMAARAERAVTISDPSVVNVSFPGYFSEVQKIIGDGRIQFT